MAIRNQLVMYLYNVSKSDALRYTRAVDLLNEFKQSQNCTDAEFYQALKYLEDKEYIQGEVASYRITGDGIEYIERNVINVVPNYEREAVELQHKNNNFAYYALIVGVFSVILTLALFFIDKVTARINPAPTPIPAPVSAPITIPMIQPELSVKSARISFENIEPSVWFIKSYQAMPNYVLGEGDCAQGDDYQRKISYCRFYRHPNDCESNQIRGALVETIFFESDAGSKAYFDDAFSDVQNSNPKLINSVGETGYFREYHPGDTHCNAKTTDKYSLVFQRNNAIGVVITWAVPNSVNDDSVQEWLNQIAIGLDTTFRENVK